MYLTSHVSSELHTFTDLTLKVTVSLMVNNNNKPLPTIRLFSKQISHADAEDVGAAAEAAGEAAVEAAEAGGASAAAAPR